jgi:hypothetical protein
MGVRRKGLTAARGEAHSSIPWFCYSFIGFCTKTVIPEHNLRIQWGQSPTFPPRGRPWRRSLFEKNQAMASVLYAVLLAPRAANRQVNRDYVPSSIFEEYARRSVYIPYLDSPLTSWANLFSSEDSTSRSFYALVLQILRKMSKVEYNANISSIVQLYGPMISDNFCVEADIWFAH